MAFRLGFIKFTRPTIILYIIEHHPLLSIITSTSTQTQPHILLQIIIYDTTLLKQIYQRLPPTAASLNLIVVFIPVPVFRHVENLKVSPTFTNLLIITQSLKLLTNFDPYQNILAGSLQTLIPAGEKLVKAKSDTSINSSVASEVGCAEVGARSKSLELLTGLPMWGEPHVTVDLLKGDHGLGFSILDYQVLCCAVDIKLNVFGLAAEFLP